MLIKLGPLAAQASGSLGGVTTGRNRGGQYLRNRSIPLNPDSPAQQEAREALRTIGQRWGEVLTDAQRDAWEAYAAAVTVTNRLGDDVHLTGQQMYIRSNTARVRAGLDPVDDGPTIYNLGSFDLPSVAFGAGMAAIELTFDDAADWVSQDGSAMLVQVTTERPPTRTYTGGPFRYADAILGDSGTAPTSPATLDAPYTFATTGNLVTARVRLAFADGRLTAPVVATGEVV